MSDRKRARELGIRIGRLQPGPFNAITDVPGVRVGHVTLISGDGPLVVGQGPVRTGVTMILPHGDDPSPLFAGYHQFNGNGEMTGIAWIEEAGLLAAPIGITNTPSVGVVHDAIIAHEVKKRGPDDVAWSLPVVAETYDGWLNDINGFHVKPEHVFDAINRAASGPIEEGCAGGGTGMNCHEFKGGIGTSSRVVSDAAGGWTVGALGQANYGRRGLLRINGVPVGEELSEAEVPTPWPRRRLIVSQHSFDRPPMLLLCVNHSASRFATLYAFGHASVVVALGLLAIWTSTILPAWVDPVMQRVVGITLIALAFWIFYSLVRYGRNFQLRSRWMVVFDLASRGWARLRNRVAGEPRPHVHSPISSQYGTGTAFRIGMLHGVGAETGSQALPLAGVAGSTTSLGGSIMLLAFTIGLLCSNSLIAVLSTFGFVSSCTRQNVYVVIGIVAGVFSLVVGILFLTGSGAVLPDLQELINRLVGYRGGA